MSRTLNAKLTVFDIPLLKKNLGIMDLHNIFSVVYLVFLFNEMIPTNFIAFTPKM